MLAKRPDETHEYNRLRYPVPGAKMTFYEAAVEVLREAGRPLHYKKIAEIASSAMLAGPLTRPC